MKTFKYILLSVVASTALMASNQEMKQSKDFYEKTLPEFFNVETELKATVGSRSGARDLLVSDVPIDVVTSEQLRTNGSLELSQILQKYVPGFNFPRPSSADGSDHVKPFTLRGLNPDQVLVLINGKRLHQSSLMNIDGTIGRGTSSVDLNTIPIAAIERVEVLRDGAAAQYGSDAIAGVINIILKGYGHKNKVTTTYGQMKKGDGETKQVDLFYSIPLEYDGFINITGEFRDKQQTNRAGADSRDQYPDGDVRNELPDPVNMHFGDPDTQDKLFMINSEVITDNGMTFYLSGLYNDRESEAAAFIRRPRDSRNNTNIYPDGFLPIIAPEIQDYSFTLGVKDMLDNGIKWDLSYTHGYNDYHFFVKNSLNTSLGDNSPTSFDAGGTNYTQEVVNLDFSKKIDSLFIATGVEYRKENYKIYQGEESSYVLGEFSSRVGSQGFPGFRPENEVDADRNNIGAYIDAKYNLNKELVVGLASRYENYSDFGSTYDGKLSATYQPVASLMFRGSGSTGFRAPSLSQSYYTSTTTSGSELYQSGTFGVNNAVSIALGAVALKPEESTHFTAGFVYQPHSDFSFSADYFYTAIDDRIMLTNDIQKDISPEVQTILADNNVEEARYFTNAISTKTDGIDLRLNYKHTFENDLHLKTKLSYHYSTTEIKSINTAPSILGEDGQDLIFDSLGRVTLEEGQPKDNIQLYSQFLYGDYVYSLNLNRFGSYKSVTKNITYDFDAKWIADVEVAYKINSLFTIAFGAENLFDTYPDKWGETGSYMGSVNGIAQYSQYSPFGYNGAFYYFRIESEF